LAWRDEKVTAVHWRSGQHRRGHLQMARYRREHGRLHVRPIRGRSAAGRPASTWRGGRSSDGTCAWDLETVLEFETRHSTHPGWASHLADDKASQLGNNTTTLSRLVTISADPAL